MLVRLESRSLEVLDHPLGELVTGIVGRVLLKQPAQQVAAVFESSEKFGRYRCVVERTIAWFSRLRRLTIREVVLNVDQPHRARRGRRAE